MTTLPLAPQPPAGRATDAATASTPTTPTPSAHSQLRAECAAGTVKCYRVRANGTTRHVPFLVGPDREIAEWLANATARGVSLATVAADTGLTLPTARRLMAALEITEAIEAGDWDDVYEPGITALYFGHVDALDEGEQR